MVPPSFSLFSESSHLSSLLVNLNPCLFTLQTKIVVSVVYMKVEDSSKLGSSIIAIRISLSPITLRVGQSLGLEDQTCLLS